MKKNLAKKITLSILTGAILLSSNVVWAAEDIKDGEGNILWEIDGTDYLRGTSNTDGVVPERTYNENFYGGFAWSGTATDGKVTISGGTFGSANNPVSIYGGFARNGDAINNAVTISGGTFAGDVFGGFVAIDNPSATCNASGNIVTISGGTFAGNIIGGYSDCGVATDNTVTISGNANLENSNLYGGAKWVEITRPQPFSGLIGIPGGTGAPNILNIGTPQYSWANLHNTSSSNNIKKIAGFDIINFEHVKWDTSNPALKVDELELADNL